MDLDDIDREIQKEPGGLLKDPTTPEPGREHESQLAAQKSRLILAELEDAERVRFAVRNDAVADISPGGALAMGPLDKPGEGFLTRWRRPHESLNFRRVQLGAQRQRIRQPQFPQRDPLSAELRQSEAPVVWGL